MPIHGYPGNVVTANPTSPTSSSASGVWTLEQQLQAQAAGNWPQPPSPAYEISRSLRFNSAVSAYLNRTPASAGNRKTWTWSGWVKRSQITTARLDLFAAGAGTDDNTFFELQFGSTTTECIRVVGYNTVFLVTTQLFRDASAWYHIVLAFDSTQATASNRIKLYVNGVQVTEFSTDNRSSITQNGDFGVNQAAIHTIGANPAPGFYFNGYLAEMNFIDGQALAPSSFGEFNATTGVWQPIEYIGTYGTNGFYLKFADNASTTALGTDSSGNGNNWTPNNFSVTAGVDNDSLVDSPMRYGEDTGAGGEVRGSYATLNPLDKNSGITLTNGNLDASMPTQVQNVYGTVSVSSGKYYWETTINSLSGRIIIGVGNAVDPSWNLDPASSATLWGYYSVNGNKTNGGSVAYGNSYTTGDVIGVAVDMDNLKIWFSKNGTWQASGDPAAGTNAAFTNLSGSVRPVYNQQLTNAVTISCNFGQRPFAYTAPSGFKALCTTNLPEPTIADGGEYFNIKEWVGTGSGQSVTGMGFQPDWLWFKQTNGTSDHALMDAVRGATKGLKSNTTGSEVTSSAGQDLVSFDADGFTTGTPTNFGSLGSSGFTIVTWGWKANGSGVSNTDGTITSTVSANTDSGFSIVRYVGDGVGSGTVGHGLGVTPNYVILKNRNATSDWYFFYGTNTFVKLNTTAAGASSTFNKNSSTFQSWVGNTNTWIAYCFAPVAGYSAMSSYVGNNSSDGPFVFTGFRPAYILIKSTASGTDWCIYDAKRLGYNVDNNLQRNAAAAQQTDNDIDFLSNGFKFRRASPNFNGSGTTHIYMAFAENPFKLALAR